MPHAESNTQSDCFPVTFDNNDRATKLSTTIELKIRNNERFLSVEVFSNPGATEEAYQQLFSDLESCFPIFYSITWHNTPEVSTRDHPSLKYFEKFTNISLLHLPAKALNRREVMHVLNRAWELGRSNILALQGDVDPREDDSNAVIDFPHAIDLVKFIRKEFGSVFSIGVAGYPQMHPRSPSKKADLYHLKEKVDAGANFIITQIIFESEVFIEFVKDCRLLGIQVPIIPGVILISNFHSLLRVSKNCKSRIPERILKDLELIKDNDVAVQEYGMKLTTRLVQEIFNSGAANGIHVFTLNRSQLVLELCQRVGLCRI